jgi:hypothetical protein
MNVQAYAYYSLSSQGNCQSIVLSNQMNAWLKHTMFICNPVCFYSPYHKLGFLIISFYSVFIGFWFTIYLLLYNLDL